jgi:alginate O-acetyltransferase complex protein AlgI
MCTDAILIQCKNFRRAVMVFTAPIFLCFFLPSLLIIYALSQIKFRMMILLFASLFFYSWGEPKAVFVMIVLIIFTWLISKTIQKNDQKNIRKKYLILGIAINLSALIIYKYLGFIVGNLNLLNLFNINPPQIALPLGISFYVFQSISYLIDIYRRDIENAPPPSKTCLIFQK